MVVDEIDIKRFAAFEPEDDSPVCTHGDGPKTLQATAECVQTVAGHIDSFYISGRMKHAEDVLDFFNVLRVQESRLPVSKSSLSPLCLKLAIIAFEVRDSSKL
jgi:hypothetical protein